MAVSELNSYISRQLQFDPILSQVLVVGEISNFKQHSSGHIYFTLKDDGSKIACVMFRSDAMTLKYQPKEGEKTEITGRVSVYEKEGRYQIYVQQMNPIGKGELYKAFMALKEQLERDQYFVKQQPIKKFPNKIGIVTSPTSAAVRDILKVLRRRNPYVEIEIYPVSVQGERAMFEIATGIEYFNTTPVDTIIVSRGGGSLEELWAFNEMMVVKAIFDSKIPVISGVGHETDFTLSDFVADKRAATPSEAAELATEEMMLFKEHLNVQMYRLKNSLLNQIQLQKLHLERSNKNKLCQLILRDIQETSQLFQQGLDRGKRSIESLLLNMSNALEKQALRLDSSSPLKTLKRGYAVVEKDHKAISSIDEVDVSDSIDIILKNGIIKTEVVSKERKTVNEEI